MPFAASLPLLLRQGAASSRGSLHLARVASRKETSSHVIRTIGTCTLRGGTAVTFRPISLCVSSFAGDKSSSSSSRNDVCTLQRRFLYERKQSFSSIHGSSLSEEAKENEEEEVCSTFGSRKRFDELPNLHPLSQKSVTKILKLETMTEIQQKTFDAASLGQDVLGRARTGTGKTLAFLLPALETVLRHNDAPGQNIGILVLSPTRELALQIHQQARKLISTHPNLTCQVVFGGSSKQEDIKKFHKHGLPTVLVATPGRLQDHLSNTHIQNKPFSKLVQNTRVVVLDETDRLLDLGFRADIEKIMSYMPPTQHRQTLLFSATLPPSVRSVMAQTMKSNYLTVDCVHDHDPATHTNDQVKQHHVILPTSKQISGTIDIILNIMNNTTPNYKLVVFFPTTLLTEYYSYIFNAILQKQVIEIHSRKSQAYRTKASNEFRKTTNNNPKKAKNNVMFTSDVSARGVDYPGVTHVVQVGMPDSRETYIHRLGRTGRAGKKGEGILVLTDVERDFLKKLDGLDIPHMDSMETDLLFESDVLSDDQDDMFAEDEEEDHPMIKMFGSDAIPDEVSWDEDYTNNAMFEPSIHGTNGQKDAGVTTKSKEMKRIQKETQRKHHTHKLPQAVEGAYRSMLGYYTANLKSIGVRSKKSLVRLVNDFAKESGIEELPRVSPRIAQSVGLVGVRGLNIGHVSKQGGGGGGGGGYGRNGGYGGNKGGRRDGKDRGQGKRRWKEERGSGPRRGGRRNDSYLR